MGSRIQGVAPKVFNGIQYRSTLEAQTAEVLTKIGIPFEYESRKMILLEGFKCPFQKDKVRSITYTPDFVIGNIIIECKGFETPEWKNKKKYIYKYLMENEPETIFYQIKDSRRQLLKALDNHWHNLGYAVEVTNKKKRKKDVVTTKMYDSIGDAMVDLHLAGKPIGKIIKSLAGIQEYVYDYNWKLKKLIL